MVDPNTLININERLGFPRTYRFNQFIRWFTLLMGFFAFGYAFWYGVLSGNISPDEKLWYKLVPFIIMFLALNSIIRNLFTLNKVLFEEDKISFKYLGKKDVVLQWENILKMEYLVKRRKAIIITFQDGKTKKQFYFGASFPKLLEIINSIVEMVPEIELDEFLKSAIVTKAEKEKYLKKVDFDKTKIDDSK
ncbi:MAG: hypothetical protein U9N34_02425 [Candidatus Cloacimonadota bacterium]|nr:hypothetical protein [Candidatus Cloacimonadota bacterium]